MSDVFSTKHFIYVILYLHLIHKRSPAGEELFLVEMTFSCKRAANMLVVAHCNGQVRDQMEVFPGLVLAALPVFLDIDQDHLLGRKHVLDDGPFTYVCAA